MLCKGYIFSRLKRNRDRKGKDVGQSDRETEKKKGRETKKKRVERQINRNVKKQRAKEKERQRDR